MTSSPDRPSAWFLGIAGAGMSALASLLQSEGWDVAGSDADAFPPVTTYLDTHAIPWRRGFDAAALPARIDVAIVGSSALLELDRNPELAELVRRGAPTASFAEFLGAHTAARDVTVVAGSFGKSTLTALLAHVVRCAGGDPGWFVGAAPLDLPASGHSGTQPAMFVEGDEYVVSPQDHRSKFLLYHPSALVLTSLTHDHLNVFPTPASYEAPFAELLGRLPRDAPLTCVRGVEAIERLTAGRPVCWYGLGPGEGWSALDIEPGETTRFTLASPIGERLAMATSLLGLHNIENIAGAAAVLLGRGLVTPEALVAGVASFRGLERRLDRKTLVSRVPVFEGFGSSWEKARSAIEAVRLHFPGRPLVVVFEPHAFSWRNQASLAWYDTVFEGVSAVVLLPPPPHGAASHDQLDQGAIAARIAAAGVSVREASDAAQATASSLALTSGDSVVLLLSSGPLAGLPRSLPPLFDARDGP